MGEIVNIRDFQTKEQAERSRKALEEHMAYEANRIMNEALWNQDAGTIGVPVDYDPRKPA